MVFFPPTKNVKKGQQNQTICFYIDLEKNIFIIITKQVEKILYNDFCLLFIFIELFLIDKVGKVIFSGNYYNVENKFLDQKNFLYIILRVKTY